MITSALKLSVCCLTLIGLVDSCSGSDNVNVTHLKSNVSNCVLKMTRVSYAARWCESCVQRGRGTGCWKWCVCTHFGWKSWRGAVLLEGLLLFRIMRDARNRKSSNSCWIRDGPERKRQSKSFTAFTEKPKHTCVLKGTGNILLINVCQSACEWPVNWILCLNATDEPNCSFSLPHSESRVLMRRRWLACRMLSASLVSSSLVHVGSKLSSQLISSSNISAGLISSCSISVSFEKQSSNLHGNWTHFNWFLRITVSRDSLWYLYIVKSVVISDAMVLHDKPTSKIHHRFLTLFCFHKIKKKNKKRTNMIVD